MTHKKTSDLQTTSAITANNNYTLVNQVGVTKKVSLTGLSQSLNPRTYFGVVLFDRYLDPNTWKSYWTAYTVADSQGNVYLNIGTDFETIVKYDAKGNQVWAKNLAYSDLYTYNRGPMCIDNNDNLIIAYRTMAANEDLMISVLKFAPTGVLEWERQISYTDWYLKPYSVAVTPSNDVVIASIAHDALGKYFVTITKYDLTGTLQWQTKIEHATNNFDSPNIDVDSLGNIITVGSMLNGATFVGHFITKVSSAGAIVWTTSLDAMQDNITEKVLVKVNSNNDIIIARIVPYANSQGMALLKYNSAGVLQWQKNFASSDTFATIEYAAIDLDDQGNIYGAGRTTSGTSLLVKHSPTGSIVWSKSLSLGWHEITSINIVGSTIVLGLLNGD